MYLVTGGAGFIGSNVAAALAERGEQVVVCDRLRSSEKWRNLAKVGLAELVTPAELSEWLPAHAAAIDAVVHMAAVSATTARDADLVVAVNLRLAQTLWRWCAAAGKRFLYASSAATYGDGAQGFDDEASSAALARLRPLNVYAWSKQLFDRWVARTLEEGGPRPPQWVGLKFFNVYGPNEYHKAAMQSVVAQKYALAATTGTVTLFRSHRADVADGAQRRDFVYVRDCVAVILWLLQHPQVSGLFNVGTGQARSFAEVAHILCATLERPGRLQYVDMPPGVRAHYQYFTEARLQRLRQAGYSAPFTALEEGIRDYVRCYLSQPDPYR